MPLSTSAYVRSVATTVHEVSVSRALNGVPNAHFQSSGCTVRSWDNATVQVGRTCCRKSHERQLSLFSLTAFANKKLECAQACIDEPACKAFGFSLKWQSCYLCSSCQEEPLAWTYSSAFVRTDSVPCSPSLPPSPQPLEQARWQNNFCSAGILGYTQSELVCCSASCGTCARGYDLDYGCSKRPGGNKKCCATAILASRLQCSRPETTGCLIRDERLDVRVFKATRLVRDRIDRVSETGSLDHWNFACRLEQARSRAHIQLLAPDRTSDLPLPNPPPANRQRSLSVLRSLLESRGTLCSGKHPCTVALVTGDLFRICLAKIGTPGQVKAGEIRSPGMCELLPHGESFALKKACDRGLHQLCFIINASAVLARAAALRNIARQNFSVGWEKLPRRAPGSAENRYSDLPRPGRSKRADKLRRMRTGSAENRYDDLPRHGRTKRVYKLRRMNRCAVVLAGHTLRCNGSWASLIDDTGSYDAVFRVNFANTALQSAETASAGQRVDFSLEINETGCYHIAMRGGSCLSDELRHGIFYGIDGRLNWASGLGKGRSGGAMMDIAQAFCDSVDVYGAGMYSEGPGSDALYQHWYDERLASSCKPHACLTKLEVSALEHAKFNYNPGKVCRPRSLCHDDRKGRTKSAKTLSTVVQGVLLSDRHIDFFLLAELRLYVLHALGLINWIWYPRMPYATPLQHSER